jgi:hypothetical protein
MGAVKNTLIQLAETLYPDNPQAQDQLLTHIMEKPDPITLTPLTLHTLKQYWETHHTLPQNLTLTTIHQILIENPPPPTL